MTFSSKPVTEHHALVGDEEHFEDEASFSEDRDDHLAVAEAGWGRAYVVSIASPDDPPFVRNARLAEILALVRAKGDEVVGHEVRVVAHIVPRTLMGPGVCTQVRTAAASAKATFWVLDAELSASQARNLEGATGLPVADREGIILEVFKQHARTRRARIQVEIARLEYLRPRIRGLGLDMDQQTGGGGPLRGPGETASELLARRLDDRLVELRRASERWGRSDTTRRKARSSARRAVLVGYTNAGKTSLMNALTGAALSARDVPFETLDITSRCLTRYGGDVLLSDTIGFIRRLPERLMASFESTLAEVGEASLLVHVVDVSDPERSTHVKTTEEILTKLGAKDTPRLFVFNKVDRLGTLPALLCSALSRGHPYMTLSSFDANAVFELERRIVQMARSEDVHARLFVPYEATEVMAMIYGRCRVLEAWPVTKGVRFMLGGDPVNIVRVQNALKRAQS